MFCGHSKMYAGAWLHRNTQSRDATTKHHQSSGRSGGSERGKTCTSSAFLPVVARPLSLRSFCSSSTLSLFNSAAGILEYSPDPVTCRARRFVVYFFFQCRWTYRCRTPGNLGNWCSPTCFAGLRLCGRVWQGYMLQVLRFSAIYVFLDPSTTDENFTFGRPCGILIVFIVVFVIVFTPTKTGVGGSQYFKNLVLISSSFLEL